jgi:hypothetical protein
VSVFSPDEPVITKVEADIISSLSPSAFARGGNDFPDTTPEGILSHFKSPLSDYERESIENGRLFSGSPIPLGRSFDPLSSELLPGYTLLLPAKSIRYKTAPTSSGDGSISGGIWSTQDFSPTYSYPHLAYVVASDLFPRCEKVGWIPGAPIQYSICTSHGTVALWLAPNKSIYMKTGIFGFLSESGEIRELPKDMLEEALLNKIRSRKV